MKHAAQPAVGGDVLQAAVQVLLHLDHRRLEGQFEAAVTPVYSWPMNNDTPLPIAEIAQRIQPIRGQRVILDADLAAFYGESTKRFNQQVKRNLARLPGDFMVQLDQVEFSGLRLQIATLETGRGRHRKYAPYVFTEHGAIMAATPAYRLCRSRRKTPAASG
jgi:ORF6N domain